MPALARAREEARKTQCRNNVHNIGIGFNLFRNDNNDIFPAWVGFGAPGDPSDEGCANELRNHDYWMQDPIGRQKAPYAGPTGGPYYQLLAKGYLRSPELFDCPSAKDIVWSSFIGKPELIEDTKFDGRSHMLIFADYAYDVGRVSKNSVAGRVYFGDDWYRQDAWWGTEWEYNHAEGSNVLCVDNVVKWAPLTEPDREWSVDLGWGNWNRKGFIPNPRMDEDLYRLELYQTIDPNTVKEDLLPPWDHDDVYVCEGSANWGTVWTGNDQQGTPWSFGGDPKEPNGYGWCSRLWGNSRIPDEPGNGGTRARGYHYWQVSRGNWVSFYPEQGPFADEGRWETHDARLMVFSPIFYIDGM